MDTINYTGQQWLNEVTIFTGEEASSVVKRLVLILYRITMIFTALRKFENGDMSEEVILDELLKNLLNTLLTQPSFGHYEKVSQ
ncbi:MAG: hypothetical protein L3J23_04590 [Flavobacteriaceae bacterium]|nr:hypothetical protein [Flavobacteriaceae bacterium]